MPKQVIGKVVSAPKGWKFRQDGLLAPVEGFTEEAFKAVYDWAREKKYGLEPDLNEAYYAEGGFNVYCIYKVFTDSLDVTEKWLGDGTWTAGTAKHSLGKTTAIHAGSNYHNSCAYCGRYGLRMWRIGHRGNHHWYCPACTEPCVSCDGRRCSVGNAAKTDKCLECEPQHKCVICAVWFPEGQVQQVKHRGGTKEQYACKTCATAYSCQSCGKYDGRRLKSQGEKKLCSECFGKAIEAERVPHEKFEESELPVGGSLKLASLSNRPVRTISIETEVDGDPHAIANTLYNEGMIREAFVEGYSTRCPDDSQWPAFLKHDGSVSGGELITFLLQLDDQAHSDSLKNVLAKLRSLEKINKVAYNPNCGGHIHIDAHNFSSDNVWRLLTGYNFLEDVIFRLAGSGAEYGHRTLVPGHDRANAGRGYSHPTAKGPWGIKSGAFRAAQSQDRMTGLNFVPYFGAVNYCVCGAGAENLRSCKCPALPKCTIEWRVWNSQGNPRILHAWVAFMQSLHAWADSAKEMTDEEEREYPPLAWTKLAWKDTSSGHKKIALERVKWIFEKLVFGEAEKDSLIYAFQHTDIEFPADFWKEIGQLTTPRNRVVKRPRYCFSRGTPICIQKPKQKVWGDARRDPEYMALVNMRANAIPRPGARIRARNPFALNNDGRFR